MTKVSKNQTFFFGQIITFGLLVAVYLVTTSPERGPDSDSYIYFDAMRPPLYPMFLWLFHWAKGYQLLFAMWVQSALCFAALVCMNYWLFVRFNCSMILNTFLSLFTISIIFFHFRVLQMIGSEGIAFPLFLITFIFLTESFYNFSIKKILLLSISTAFLILTRAQFYYFYFLFIALIIWNFIKNVNFKNKILFSIMILITSIVLTETINCTYHYYVHGSFYGTRVLGKQLIVQALYLSDSTAERFFKNQKDKKTFKKLISQLEQKQLTANSAPSVLHPPLGLHTIYPYYWEIYPSILESNSINLNEIPVFQQDDVTLEISKTLYLNQFKKNIMFYLWKINSFFGDIAFFISFLLILFSIWFRVLIIKIQQLHFFDLFIALSFITILLNTAFVAIFEPVLPYYSLYSYFLIFCLGVLVAHKYQRYL